MGKIDIEFRSNSCQGTIGRVKQGICGKIIHRSEPFALEDSPQSLCDIQQTLLVCQLYNFDFCDSRKCLCL